MGRKSSPSQSHSMNDLSKLPPGIMTAIRICISSKMLLDSMSLVMYNSPVRVKEHVQSNLYSRKWKYMPDACLYEAIAWHCRAVFLELFVPAANRFDQGAINPQHEFPKNKVALKIHKSRGVLKTKFILIEHHCGWGFAKFLLSQKGIPSKSRKYLHSREERRHEIVIKIMIRAIELNHPFNLMNNGWKTNTSQATNLTINLYYVWTNPL